MNTIVRVFVSTQIRENYGAHCWDGKGECPQYWKSKGGHEYLVAEIVCDISRLEEAKALAEKVASEASVSRDDEYYQEYVLGTGVLCEADWAERDAKLEDYYCGDVQAIKWATCRDNVKKYDLTEVEKPSTSMELAFAGLEVEKNAA